MIKSHQGYFLQRLGYMRRVVLVQFCRKAHTSASFGRARDQLGVASEPYIPLLTVVTQITPQSN